MLQRNKPKADYGQDVPGLVREKLLFGGILAAEGVVIILRWRQARKRTTGLLSVLGVAALISGAFAELEGLALIWGSRVGKPHLRDTLLDGLQLRGNETVLDIGCGHGLLLIGAAKRVPQGCAIGIDLWSQVDQGGNSRAATLANAMIEGVHDRVEIHDGDMRALSFANNSFDAVVACQAVHNIESREGRAQAIGEIVRVLKPGGKLALMDIFYIDEYQEALLVLGMQQVQVSGRNWWYYPPVRTVTASK